MDIKDEDGRYHGLAVIHVKNPFKNHPNQSRRMLYSMKKKAAPHPNFTQNAIVVCPKLLFKQKKSALFSNVKASWVTAF